MEFICYSRFGLKFVHKKRHDIGLIVRTKMVGLDG